MNHAPAQFHARADAQMLRQTAAPGQLAGFGPQQPPAGRPAIDHEGGLWAMAILIADEACRVDIECRARGVPSTYPHPVYDVTQHEVEQINDEEMIAADMEAIARAVRYLDLRELLVRPIPGQPQFVSFGRV